MAEQDLEKQSLFKEIDEELRNEKLANLWKNYGKYLVGAIIITVVGVAGFKIWEAHDLNNRTTDSAKYAEALVLLEKNDIKSALSKFSNLSVNGSLGYATLARLNTANTLLQRGEPSEAHKIYSDLANNNSADPIFRDLASILHAINTLGKHDSKRSKERIEQLANSQSPWRHSAKEILALMEQKNGNFENAKKLFTELADDMTTPNGIRSRSTEMSKIVRQ